ncbi:MAG TPA: patatin-like phospholipase family protein [Beijerinckiaceae bacterium]|jgi:NTE family protein
MSRRPRPTPASAPRGLAGPKAEKSISLALQGGGAHGAFTWGVLDYLLEDGRLAIEAISGASAGAMNAVVLADGWVAGGADGARAGLETFWRRVSLDGSLNPVQRALFDRFLGHWCSDGSPIQLWLDVWQRAVSPYETNPLDINPLRDAVDDSIDFGRLRAAPDDVKLFIAATNVWTGKTAIFTRSELTADHVLASACLPTLFKAVEIQGVPYWDGGYMGNPALYPLFYDTAADDVLLVQINPIERRTTPTTAHAIQNRLTEITFNGGLLRELRAVDFVLRLIDEGKLSRDEYKRVLMHRIDGGRELDAYTAASRLNADWNFFQELRDVGRSCAKDWLDAHYDDVGHRATLDLKQAYA